MTSEPKPWFEDADHTFCDDVAPEAEGEDFIQDVNISSSYLRTTIVKRQVANVTGYFGAPKPKKGSAEARQRKLEEWTEMIPFAAQMTKHTNEKCALPVPVETIRNYKLEKKDFKLPPYTVTDCSTLMKFFIDLVQNSYEQWCEVDKQDFFDKCPNGKYLPRTDFGTIRTPLADIIRYCIKYWHLHPWLSRADAYKNAIAHLEKEYSSTRTPKILIDEILRERKDVILKKQLLGLETVPKDETEPDGERVFAENDDAQPVIVQYLKSQKWKTKKEYFDPLLDLKDCIETFTVTTEKLEWKAKFDNVVPKETTAYLEKKAKAEEKEQKRQRVMEASKVKEAEKAEKKRKALEESQAEDAAAAAAAAATAAAARTDAPTTTGGATVTPPGSPDEEMEDIVTSDPYWEFKLKISGFEIIELKSTGAKSVRQAKKLREEQRFLGIQKTIMGFNGKNSVRVQYEHPGVYWKNGFTHRYVTVFNAFNSYGADPLGDSIVEDCIYGKDNTTITKQCGRVVLAVMLHSAAKSDKDYASLGLHPSFHETNFLVDLKNTKQLWLPPLLAGSPLAMHGLYQLICAEEEMAGTKKDNRVELFLKFIGEISNVTAETAKLVAEIVSVLQYLVQEINGSNFGKKKIPIDPFNTRSDVGTK